MKSAGNDIVALKVIDKQRTCQPEFYSKFVTPAEQALHLPELIFENFVWLLWSVKEAAYKHLKRYNHELIFSPSKITVQQIEITSQAEYGQWESDQPVQTIYKGFVAYDTYKLCFRSIVHNEFITTVVNDTESFKNVYWGIKLIDEADTASQSEKVRSFVLNRLSNLFPDDKLSIEKSPAGYPILLSGTKKVDIPVSFAHHDHYVGYSFLTSTNPK